MSRLTPRSLASGRRAAACAAGSGDARGQAADTTPRQASPPARPLWSCPKCGRRFATRHQTHTCAKLDLRHHFQGRPGAIRQLYKAFVKAVRAIGPVTVLPEKTRIAFQTRMSFAQLTPRSTHMSGHLVLAEVSSSKRFHRIETISPRNHVHHFRLVSPAELDAEFTALLAQAYAVGNQEHLVRKSNGAARSRRG